MKSEKVYDQTFTARDFNTNPVTISGLKGDLYDYHMIFQVAANSSYTFFRYYPNNDTTSNYRRYYMWGRGSSVLGQVLDATSATYITSTGSAGTNPHLAILSFTGSSGDERYIDIFSSLNDNTNSAVSKWSNYWKNTIDEMTSIKIDASNTVTHDAHIILYRTPKEASQEKWELVDTYSGTSVNYNTETEIFNGLDGNQDIQYKMVLRYDAGTNSDLGFRINSDSAASQYINQDLRNSGGSIQAGNNSRSHCQFTGSTGAENGLTDVEVIINAETGNRRLIVISYANINAGTDQSETAAWYKDTATNISTLELYDPISVTTNSLTAKLYRRKNPNTIGDTLPFEMVEEVAVSGDFSAGHTFSGLSGDDVLMYKLEWLGDGDGTSRTNVNDLYLRAQFNGDTAANYINQDLRSYGSSADANNTTKNHIEFFNTSIGGLENEGQFTCYIYPKSGENRPCLIDSAVDYGNKLTKKGAGWWSNSSDEINSIKVFANQTYSITGTLKLSRIMAKVPFLTYSHTWGGAAQIQSNEADLESTSSSYIQVTDDSANWDLGTGAFTIEIENLTFESFPAIGGLDDIYRIIGEGRGISGTGPRKTGWTMSYDKTNNELRLDRYDGTTVTTKKVSWTASTATAYDLAIVRDGDNVYFYVDGTQQGSTQTGVSATSYNREEANGLYIGSYEYGGGPTTSYLDGQIGAIRVENVARYTGSSYTVESLINTRNTLYLNTFTGADTSTPSENTP